MRVDQPLAAESSPAAPLTAYPGYEMQPSLSPDGSQVAFAWNGPTEDNFDIYVKLVGPGRPVAVDDESCLGGQPRLVARRTVYSLLTL